MNSLSPSPAAAILPARRSFALLFALSLAFAPAAGAKSISAPTGTKGKPVVHGKKAAKPAAAPGAPAAAAATGNLDATERKIAEAVDRGAAASLALLESTVNVNSGTMNFDGVRQVGQMFEPALTALGFTTRWVDGAAWGRAGHLIARRVPGGAGEEAAQGGRRPGVRFVSTRPAPRGVPKVLLVGHLDTVFEKDSPFQRWRRLSDSSATGPGICDMKGGDAVMLLALRALKDAGVLDRLAVAVYLGGDEERPGQPMALARRDLAEAAEWADVAIGLENGAGDPRVALIARRGSIDWKLAVTGKPYHSGQIFREDVGAGAIYEAARILDGFRTTLSSEKYLTFSPGLVLGGTDVAWDSTGSRGTAFGKTNVIAEHAIVTGDLRALSPEQVENARQAMQGVVAKHLPQTRATLEFHEGYPPLAPTDGNRRLLAIYDGASRDLGLGAVEASDPSRAGAADVSFCARSVDMAMDGVGLMGAAGHTVDETADLRTLPTQAKRLAITLARLAEGGGRK